MIIFCKSCDLIYVKAFDLLQPTHLETFVWEVVREIKVIDWYSWEKEEEEKKRRSG